MSTVLDEHRPVMPDEVIQALAIRSDGIFVDSTFGRGGHSRLILEGLGNAGRLLGLDRDPHALRSKAAGELTRSPKFELEKCNLMALEDAVNARGWSGKVAGVLMDLGVSSPQLDDASRGFSFTREGPLDMRMDTTKGVTASQWLNQVPEKDLKRVLKIYGEERFAGRIARAVVSSRASSPIRSTLQLSRLVEQAIPVRDPHKHPATRTFQAVRIFINQELEELRAGLEQAVEILEPGGRLVVISFHSLEDRIVKRFIRQEVRGGDFPAGLPVSANAFQPRLRSLGRARKPKSAEIVDNPRARSATLRTAERLA